MSPRAPTAEETTDLIAFINDIAPIGPTCREIMSMWGMKSLSQTKRKLIALKAQGIIDWRTNRARSIQIRRAKFFIIEKKAKAYDAHLVPMGETA